MQITLNNNIEKFEQKQLSIQEILEIKNFSFRMILIKLNDKLVNKTEHNSTFVKDGDDLKIIHLMSGG